jgi:hypothetical protein
MVFRRDLSAVKPVSVRQSRKSSMHFEAVHKKMQLIISVIALLQSSASTE